MARLFVAAWPTDLVRTRLREVPRPELAGLRWSRPDQWHVTLRFLGDADADAVRDRLDGSTLPASTVRLGPAIDHLGPRLLTVPASGADDLARAVRAATADLGERAQHRFRGHLTIARAKRSVALPLLGHPFDASFDVHEVALVASELGADGAIYTTLATFPTETRSGQHSSSGHVGQRLE